MWFSVAERNQVRGEHSAAAARVDAAGPQVGIAALRVDTAGPRADSAGPQVDVGAARVNAALPGGRAGARRSAGGLRPSQVPVPGEAGQLNRVPQGAGLGGPAVQRARRVRPGGSPARPSMVSAEPVRDVLRGPGRPLAGPVREDMEARLGANLADVRIHTDSMAHRAAEAVSARAFTSGSHIAFERSQYNPASAAGRQTLAHELTHVLQQRSGPVTGIDHGGLLVSEPSDRFERAAEENANRAMSGTAAFRGGRDASPPVQPSRRAAAIQRYTAVGDRAGTIVSQNGLYKIIPGVPTVWVQINTLVTNVLQPLTRGTAMARFPGYIAYQVDRLVLKDCLHAAEEIINEMPGELEQGDDQGGGGLHSTIRINTPNGPRAKKFGRGYTQNVNLANRFAGPRNINANPGVGEAFVIIATNPQGTMSPYHAAAVVGRDGNDAITLETWAGRGASLPKADVYEVGSNTMSFHSHWSTQYFGASAPVTVVLGPAAPADIVPAAKRQRLNSNVQ